MFVFSLDPSINNLGWVYCHITNTSTEKWQHRIKVLKSGAMNVPKNLETPLEKLSYIFETLNYLISKYHIDIFLLEEILSNSNPYSSIILCKAQAIIISVALQNKIPLKVYNCKTARKIVTGNGNIKKSQIKEFFLGNTPFIMQNNHVYDALLLVLAYWCDSFQYETPILKKIRQKRTKKKDTENIKVKKKRSLS